MPTEIRWLASTSTSSLHAAATILRGQTIADSDLASAISAPSELLAHEIDVTGNDRSKLLSQLIPLSATIDNNRQLTDTAAKKAYGPNALSDTAIARIAGAISELENSFVHCHPKAMQEIETRGRLLREQWESRGPGMLASISRHTDGSLLVEHADTVLVHPTANGGGVACPPLNTVVIEAVLTNPDAALPEVMRLGWMLSTLNLDLPIYRDVIHADRLPIIGALAMLPPSIQAGQDVEWCGLDDSLVEHAIVRWGIDVVDPVATSDVLRRWWSTYQSAQPRWSVALAALDQTIRERNLIAATS